MAKRFNLDELDKRIRKSLTPKNTGTSVIQRLKNTVRRRK